MAFALPPLTTEQPLQPQPSEPLPPLHFAALNCSAAAVDSLLRQGHIPSAPAPGSGLSVLHYAVNNPDTGVLRALLSAGSPVDGAFDRSRGQLTPLLLAAWLGNYVAVADLIAAGANLQRVDSNRKGALILAASNGHSAVINKLLSVGAAVDEEDSCGGTALEWAALEGQLDAVRTLATHGADLTHQDHNGRTALILAALQGHEGVVAELLRWDGAMLASITDMDGRTALHWAAVQGHQGAVHQLVAVPGSANLLTARDVAGRTPMMLAAQYGRPATVCTLLQAVAAAAGEKAAQESALAAAGLAKGAGFLRLAATLDPSISLSASAASSPQQSSIADNGGELSWMADLQSEWDSPVKKENGGIGFRTPRLAYGANHAAPPSTVMSAISTTPLIPLQSSVAIDAVRLSQSFLKPLPGSTDSRNSMQMSPVRRSFMMASASVRHPKQSSVSRKQEGHGDYLKTSDHQMDSTLGPVQEVRVDARYAREFQERFAAESKFAEASCSEADGGSSTHRQSAEAKPRPCVNTRVSGLPKPGFSSARNAEPSSESYPPRPALSDPCDEFGSTMPAPASRFPGQTSASPAKPNTTKRGEQQATATRDTASGLRKPSALSVPASPAHPACSPGAPGSGCSSVGRRSAVLNSPVNCGGSRIPRPATRPPSAAVTPVTSATSSPVCPRTTPFRPPPSPVNTAARSGRSARANRGAPRQVSMSASPVAAHSRKPAVSKAAAHLNRLDAASKARSTCRRGKPQSKSLAILPSERSCLERSSERPFGRTQLMCAAAEGLLSKTDALLSAGTALEARDSEGNTALLYACRRGHLQVAERLLHAGAKVDAANEGGRHAMLEAAAQGNAKLVTALLQSNNGGRQLAQRADGAGRAPLYEAAAHGHVGAVKALLQTLDGSVADIDNADNEGRTPLMAAAGGGHTAVVSLLMSHGADLTKTDGRGWSAITEAACAGHRDTTMALVKRWKSASAKCASSEPAADGAVGAAALWRRLLNIALLEAASGGQPSAAEVLLENGADDAFVDDSGRIALLEAVKGGHAKVVAVMASRTIRSRHSAARKSGQGCTLISIVRDSRGRTALHVAADSAGETSNAMRRALLSAAPAALLDAPDAAGRSPLTAAAEVGDCALISALLAAGAELGDGLSPVLLAARSGRVQALELLLSKLPAHSEAVAGQAALVAASASGCLPSIRSLLRLTGNRALSVHRADEGGRLALVEAARAGHCSVANLLLERAARPEEPDVSGDSAFSAACREGHLKILDLVYQRIPRRAQRKALLDQSPRGGQPPLVCAAAAGQEEAARWLIARGAGVDCTDSEGRTASVTAAIGRHWETLKILLDAGADPNLADDEGATAMGLVMEAGDQDGDDGAFEVMELLADRSSPIDDNRLAVVPPSTPRAPYRRRLLRMAVSLPLAPIALPFRFARAVLVRPRVALGAVLAAQIAHAMRPDLLPTARDHLRRHFPHLTLRPPKPLYNIP